MATNPYFNNYYGVPQQNLIEDLTIQAIKMYGHDFIYLPRESVSVDYLFGEDRQTYFDNAYTLEMYIENVDGFDGGHQLILAEVGMQVVNQATLMVSKKRFEEAVPMRNQPQEGDLIFFPMTNGLFEINYSEFDNPFYQLGKLYSYRLTIELFTASHEEFDTGHDNIDRVADDYSADEVLAIGDNEEIETEKDTILDEESKQEQSNPTHELDDSFDENNPFGDI